MAAVGAAGGDGGGGGGGAAAGGGDEAWEDNDGEEDRAIAGGDRGRCERLRISYPDPAASTRLLSEDVFLDPRDVWRVDGLNDTTGSLETLGKPAKSGGNLLLVNSSAVTALQHASDRQDKYTANTQEVTDACRRDFLREQRRLLEELDLMTRKIVEMDAAMKRQTQIKDEEAAAEAATGLAAATEAAAPPGQAAPGEGAAGAAGGRALVRKPTSLRRVPTKSLLSEVQALRDKASELIEAAEGGAEAVVTPEDAELIASSVGPQKPVDEDARDILKAAGFEGADIFTENLLLRMQAEATEDIAEERNRLRLILEALEANSTTASMIEALLSAIKTDGASIMEVVIALIEMVPTQADREKIQEKASNGIKQRYEKLSKQHQEMEPKVAEWRETLRRQSEKSQRASELESEVSMMMDKLERKESAERQAVEDFERRRLERYERRKKRREERDRKIAEMEKMRKDPNAHIDVFEYLATEDRDKLRREENLYEATLRKAEAQEDRAAQFELNFEAGQWEMKKLLERRRHAEDTIAFLKQEVAAYEEQIAQDEAAAKAAAQQMKDIRKRLKVVQEEYAVATRPPPPERDLSGMESEIQEAEAKNQELREEAAQLCGRVELYERRWERAEGIVLAKKEEEAAAEFNARAESSAAARPSRKTGKRPSDPMLMEYHERVTLPEYSNQQRHLVLHTDDRARDRRQRRRQQDIFGSESAKLLSRLPQPSTSEEGEARAAASTTSPSAPSAGSSAGAPLHVPVSFRRGEDLRVRRAGAQRAVGNIVDELSGVDQRFIGAHEELRGLGRRLGEKSEEAAKVHAEVSDRLSLALTSGGGGSGSGSAGPAAAEGGAEDGEMRWALLEALEGHKAALSRTEEAWHLAELGCERGVAEESLVTEGRACTVCEEELTVAMRHLYVTAAKAASDGPESLMAASKRCLADWDNSEPRLIAARAACNLALPQALRAARGLEREREAQGGLRTLLRAEEHRRNLLEAELVAPPEARRALAAVRTATAAASTASSSVSPPRPQRSSSPPLVE